MSLEAALTQQITEAVIAEVRRRLPELSVPTVAPRYMTTTQAGEYIGKSADAIRMMVSRKEIPAIHAGRRTVRIDKNDLDTWATRRRY